MTELGDRSDMGRQMMMALALMALMAVAAGAGAGDQEEGHDDLTARGEDIETRSESSLPISSEPLDPIATSGGEQQQDKLHMQGAAATGTRSHIDERSDTRGAQDETHQDEGEDELLSAVAKFKERKRREKEAAEKAKKEQQDQIISPPSQSPTPPSNPPTEEAMDEVDLFSTPLLFLLLTPSRDLH
eukprot:767713-Hanusia_phi.AAC.1